MFHHIRFNGIMLTAAALIGSPSLGCVASTDAEPLGEDQAALGTWFWTWGTRSGAPVPIGSSNDRTCFLAGVAGDLSSGVWDGSGSPSRAQTYMSGGNWYLEARSGQLSDGTNVLDQVEAQAVCISSVTNRYMLEWSYPSSPIPLQPVTPQRRCFLGGVSAAAGALWNPYHWVKVFQADYQGTPYWWIGGSVGGGDLDVLATAVCVDLPPGTTAPSQPVGPYTAPDSTLFWADSGAGICGLNGFQGEFDFNDWTNGVLITPPSSFPGFFSLNVTSGKAGWYTCMR